MLGLITGCVAVTLLADAALNPDVRRRVRAWRRARRLAEQREDRAYREQFIAADEAHARRMRTVAAAQLPRPRRNHAA